MPVQVIWGGDDRIVPAAAWRGALAEGLPVHPIAAAGRLPHMGKSAEVNRLIAGFVGG